MKIITEKFKTGFFMLLLLFALMPAIKSYAATDAAYDATVSLPLNGTAIEQEFIRNGYWTFTAPDDGTVTVTLKAHQGSMRGSLCRKAGAPTYSLFLEDFPDIEEGTDSECVTQTTDVLKGKEYRIELIHYGDTIARASVSAVFTEAQKVTGIQLDKEQLILTLDDTEMLNAFVYPDNAANKSLEWTSSNPQVVHTSENGSIWARNIGQATVTVKSKDGGNAFASCVVIVVPNKMDAVKQNKEKTTRSKVSIYWKPVSRANGYHVYKYNNAKKKYVLYKDTKDSKVTITGMSAEKSCKVKVAAYVEVGDKQYEAPLSNAVTAWSAPKKVSATKIKSIQRFKSDATFNYIKVSWKKVKMATGYKVYCKYDGSYRLLGTTKKTSTQLFTGRGFKYKIKVVAYRSKHGMTTNAKASNIKTYNSR